MNVTVKQSVEELTDGRERFAGRNGVVEVPAFGRLALNPDNLLLPGEQFEHAYLVKFEDGDEAVFLASELEGEGVESTFRELTGPAFGGRDAAASAETASVQEVKP